MTTSQTTLTVSPDQAPESEPILADEAQKIKRRSVSGAMSFLLRTMVIQGIGFVAQVIISAYFIPADYAVYSFVIQIIGLLTFFSDIGFAAALVQKKTEPDLREYRTAFTVQQFLSWLIVVVTLVLAASGVINQQLGSNGIWLLVALAISFPLASLKTISSIMLERKLEFSKLAMPQIFEQLVFQGILIGLALNGYGVMSYTYAILARSIVGVVIMWYLQPWKLGFAFDKTALKDLLNFGAKFQLNDFLARIKDQLFTIFLRFFMTENEFGYMQWAKGWSLYPYNLTVQNVLAVTFPTFSRLQGHPELLRKAIEKTLFFITLAIFPLLVGMCIFIWPVTQVIGKYGKWEPAIFSFVLFTLSIMGAAISTPMTNTLNALGKINDSLKLMIVWTILTWVLTPLGLRLYGFNGVAIAGFIISLTSVLPIFMLKKYITINITEQIWRQALASALMAVIGVVGLKIWSSSLQMMLLGMVVVGASYFAALGLIGFQKVKTEILSLKN